MTSPSAPLAAVVVLAAGEGTRMRSSIPKVLHEIGGRPLLGHVLLAAAHLRPAARREHHSESLRSSAVEE